MNPKPVAIISAILIRPSPDGRTFEVFLQERWKPKISPTYSGMWEIPAGGIDSYESVYDALRREVREECGFKIKNIWGQNDIEVREPRSGDKVMAFEPFVCQQALQTNDGLPWVGFVFVCEIEGECKMDLSEARNPEWVEERKLEEMLENFPEKFFPIQLPVLKKFIEMDKPIFPL